MARPPIYGSLGSDSALPTLAQHTAPVDPTPVSVEDGSFHGRYATLDLLGEGGMGEVRRCHDRRIGRDVALKVIRAGHGSRSDLRARFVREARVQGQLEHPSVVPVYELGVDPDGSAYFTMKRVQGLTLAQVIDGLRRSDPAVALRYSRRRLLSAFSGVCLAVAFAHSRGVVHRDLKPGNVMLGEFGEVHVLDWGLAKVSGTTDLPSVSELVKAGDSDQGMTIDGAILGTPGYMAPEQARGETDAVGPSSDVYALGAILFELLTHEPLHPATSTQAALVSTLAGADARPSARRPDLAVAPELDAVCVRATAATPGERFGGARELHEAIERFLDGDRDLERRRQMAEAHVRSAQQALASSPGQPTPPAERARALRELQAALALDPTNAHAVPMLLRVLAESMSEAPPEAEAELAKAVHATRQRTSRETTLAYLSCYIVVPYVAIAGVRSPAAVMVLLTVLTTALSFAWWMSTPRGKTDRPSQIIALVLATLTVAATIPLFGFFTLAPAVMAITILVFIIQMRVDRFMQTMSLLLGTLAIFVPALLGLLGLLPRAYDFRDGAIRILPWMSDFPEHATTLFLLMSSVMVVAIPAVLVGRAVDTLVAGERRLFLQAWNLAHLVPDPARGGAR